MKPSLGGTYRGTKIAKIRSDLNESTKHDTVAGELVAVLRMGDATWAVIEHRYGQAACEYRTLEKEEETPI